jgi:opacity protein-like surface antigen
MISRALGLGLATLLFASSAAYAEGPEDPSRTGVYLEAYGQLNIEDFHSTTNRGTPDSGIGGAVGFRAGWRAARPIAIEVTYERIFNLLEENDANIVIVSGKYLMLLERRYQPFIRTGFGAIFGNLPTYWTRRNGTWQSSFVWKIGAGLDYVITDHLIASLYGDYVIPTEEYHKLNFGAVGLGLRYKF